MISGVARAGAGGANIDACYQRAEANAGIARARTEQNYLRQQQQIQQKSLQESSRYVGGGGQAVSHSDAKMKACEKRELSFLNKGQDLPARDACHRVLGR